MCYYKVVQIDIQYPSDVRIQTGLEKDDVKGMESI